MRGGESLFRSAAIAVFLAMLVVACVWDVRVRKIPNWLNASLAVVGSCFVIIEHPVLPGIGIAMGGALVGLLIWFPSYVFRLLGAGDVKLAAAGGIWLGPLGAFEAAVIGGILGGLLALVWMLRFRGVRGAAATLWLARVLPSTLVERRLDVPTREHLPYSVALSLGLAIAAWLPKHLF